MRLLLATALAALLAGAAHGAGTGASRSRIAFGPRARRSQQHLHRAGERHRPAPPDLPPTRQQLGGDSGPVWSSNGRRIVFERNLTYWGADRYRLAAVPVAGGLARQLTKGPYDAMPTLSPRRTPDRLRAVDGCDRLALHGRPARPPRGTAALGRPRPQPRLVAGRQDHRLLAPGRSLGRDRGSNALPGGLQRLEPARSRAGPGSGRVASLVAGRPQDRLRFVCRPQRPRLPGRRLSPSGEIYVVDADGSNLTRLTTSQADDEHPTWSPDGSRIAFASGFILASQGHPPWLMTIPSGGGSATRVGRFSGVLDPAWSPAGVR